jgi:hypothetical protein
MNDEQRALRSLNDHHALRLKFFQRADANEGIGARLFVKSGHGAHPIEPPPTRRERRTGVVTGYVQQGINFPIKPRETAVRPTRPAGGRRYR